eukprot:160210-Amphidinium_carterae.1
MQAQKKSWYKQKAFFCVHHFIFKIHYNCSTAVLQRMNHIMRTIAATTTTPTTWSQTTICNALCK